MNKKAISISISLLVLSTLILSVLSLYYFYIKDKKISNFYIGDINKIYEKQELLDFYLGDIFDKSSKDFSFEQGKREFLNKFKKELDNYKDKNELYPLEALRQAEQVNENNIELNENKLILKLELKLNQAYASKTEYYSINYNYKKNFEKVFK